MKKIPIVLILILGIIVLIYTDAIKKPENKSSAVPLKQQRMDPSIETARSFIDKGDLVSAERELLKDFDINDYDDQKFYLLSFIYIKSGDFPEAFKYAKPLAEQSVDPQILTDLGSLFAMTGYDKMAFACYSKALNVEQGHIPAYIELGKLYGNQNQFVQAISVWQDGLRIEPDNQDLMELIRQGNVLLQEEQAAP